jgi:hypothetical protein
VKKIIVHHPPFLRQPGTWNSENYGQISNNCFFIFCGNVHLLHKGDLLCTGNVQDRYSTMHLSGRFDLKINGVDNK